MLPNFKNGWALTRTTRQKPTGYKGYIFTLYGVDDVTVIAEARAKTTGGIWNKVIRLMREQEG